MTQDELRRRCEDEARETIELVNKAVRGNGVWDLNLENKITEALLQKELRIQELEEMLKCR